MIMNTFFVKRIRGLGLLAAALAMSLASVWAVGENETPEALNVYFYNSDVVQSTLLDDLQGISFSGDNLLLQTQGSNKTSISLNDVRKITFGEAIPNSVTPVVKDSDIRVYVTPQSEVVIETLRKILSLNIFDITGKKCLTSVETDLNISALSSGIYLLQINTAQGSVTKKIIKQ